MVLLIGLRLLRVRRHDDPAVEGHLRGAAGNAVDELMRDAPRCPVVHEDPEIHPFIGAAQVQALDIGLRPFPDEVDGDVDIPGLTGKDDEGQFELFPGMDRVRFLDSAFGSARNDRRVLSTKRSAWRNLERISVITVPHR